MVQNRKDTRNKQYPLHLPPQQVQKDKAIGLLLLAASDFAIGFQTIGRSLSAYMRYLQIVSTNYRHQVTQQLQLHISYKFSSVLPNAELTRRSTAQNDEPAANGRVE